MRSYQNPFRSRASEQQRDTFGFLRYVGAGVLDLLPEAIWDRPLIVRSASGGGKTTLLRVFATECLVEAYERREDLPELYDRLVKVGALQEDGPNRIGVLLNLGRDYRTIATSGAPHDVASRLFLRLLDARIAAAFVRSALLLQGLDYPRDAWRLEFHLRHHDERASAAAARMGGMTGDAVVAEARATEAEIVDLVDSLLPVDWAATSRGHAELYALRLLSDAEVFVDGAPITAQPLLLLDDGHELAEYQRRALLTALLDRDIAVARWYAERFEALPTTELLQDDTPGRDYEVLELERAARETAPLGRRRFNKLLREVGNLRAGRHLERYARGARDFFEYLAEPDTEVPLDLTERARADALAVADGNPGYVNWVDQADVGRARYERAVRIRSAQILIERYRRRPQQELFDEDNGTTFDALQKSDIREAARLFLAREHDLPYYAGEDAVVAVSSQNVEQFLRVCGDLFEFMLAKITLNETPTIVASRQHALIRKASDSYWRELPTRLPNSPDVLALLNKIAEISLAETARPTAPYAPGVNGIAISMEDRARLLDPGVRTSIPGAERLFEALGVAIARNVLVAEPNYSVKNTRVMVLYLNRLLCPRLFLPLQRGSFRERRLLEVAGWLLEEQPSPPLLPEVLFEL